MTPHCYICHRYHHPNTEGHEMTDSPEEEEALDRDAEEYQRDKRIGAAWMDISTDVLRRFLDLPDNTEILDAISAGRDTIALLISSPDINPIAMRVRAVYSGAFVDHNSFKGWKITAKLSSELDVRNKIVELGLAEQRTLATFSMSAPIEDIRAATDEGGSEI